MTMPWHPIDLPSLQVGLLHTLVSHTRPGDEVREFHGSLRWAEFLLKHSGGRLRPGDYVRVGSDSIFHGLGDWVFSGVLYDDPDWGAGTLRDYAGRRGVAIDTAVEMRRYAGEFVAECAAAVLAEEPDVVGFTTTFMQNVPSLALARELKSRRPQLTVVFGGSNCDGPMGHALHRNHPFVDHVVRGEGEHAFPALLRHLDAGTDPADVPGLCWWDGEVSRANPESRRTVAPADIPSPDYDDWQRALDASPVAEYVHPKLVVEGARGCWWGEKHHCTFCGLNGSAMAFRAKPGERLWSEVDRLVRRHRILDVVTVDNIIDMAYFRDFLPRAAASGWDLRMHYEVKSNLTPDQLALLADSGTVHIQPGIESLGSRVLDLMDKGVTGARNIRTLRECENHSLTCSWNLLYGFPGESAEDYTGVVDQLPALVHLQPPGGAHRIQLERFSPHFNDPALGFGERRPAEMYRHVYDLPEDELADLVYLFDTEDAGISGDVEARLKAAVERWLLGHPTSRLTFAEDGDDLLVQDRREGWPRREHRFRGWRADALRHLEAGRNETALHRLLTGAGHDCSPGELAQWLQHAVELGLLFRDGRTFVSLPTWGEPVRVDQPGHAYGMLYHRRGPDFVIVMDRRDKEASARYTLDDPDLLATFDLLHTPVPLTELSDVQREAVALLTGEGLARVTDGHAVALPPRIGRWPVPCTGI
ncbi:RiPP maturation radical SAM C-methyltransferase [Streptomyces sp. CdTB01]|uniref:RiPP maturation radical SAM C-methyltransferase n=1 Tax=Streptomyces sp. CdTB01 TaxID=1725411 RepID=UPI0023B16D2F|nr:RiPP maturation radical SAM C-methyltransferase [Streptomyces sp. CdTB01]